MRVISQDGTIDIPYGLTSIQLVSKTTIVAQGSYFGSGNDNFATIAEYSTKAKAIKAMEMLREHNEGVIFLKTIINTEKCTPFIRSLSKTDFDKLTQNYFQFPQDDEIEV